MTRVFAAVLAVLCLVMLLAGAAGLMQAAADRKADKEDIERLQARIEEYRGVDAALEGAVSYEREKASLDAQQKKHSEETSEHRRALAEYTATRGGLTQGAAMLDQADAAMAWGVAQYNAGLSEFQAQEAAFNEGYEQFIQGAEQLEQGWQQYNAAAELLSAAEAELAKLSGIGSLIESGDKAAIVNQGLQEIDTALAAYDQTAEYVQELAGQGVISAEQLRQIEDAVTAAAGMTPAELRAAAQVVRDGIAAADADELIPDEQFDELKRIYNENKDIINAAASAVAEQIAEYKAQLEQTREQLEAAQAEIDKLAPVMEEGKKGIELGREQLEQAKAQMDKGAEELYYNRTMLWYNMGKLKDQAAELKEEKQELQKTAEELESKSASAEEKNALEQRRNSLRLMLLDRSGIEQRVDSGMELISAAEDYAAALNAENERSFQYRTAAYILLLIGGIAGFVGIPAAFEKTKKRALLIVPPAVCFACAAAAEAICVSMGRGSSYSALGVIIFAAIQLILVVPKKKVNV